MLATRHAVAAVVLFGAFTSVPDRAAELYPSLPVRANPPTQPTPAQPPAPGAEAGVQGAQPGVGARDCLAGLENFNLSLVAARRIPLVDEEAQVVLAYGVFIRRPGSPTPRNAASWWFVVDEGKIRVTYTAIFYPPPQLAVPNWPPYHGNWPLPATTVPTPPPPPPTR